MLVGYGMAGGRSRNWLHILGFATAMTLAAYVLIDCQSNSPASVSRSRS
jgi:hypothetical protein